MLKLAHLYAWPKACISKSWRMLSAESNYQEKMCVESDFQRSEKFIF